MQRLYRQLAGAWRHARNRLLIQQRGLARHHRAPATSRRTARLATARFAAAQTDRGAWRQKRAVVAQRERAIEDNHAIGQNRENRRHRRVWPVGWDGFCPLLSAELRRTRCKRSIRLWVILEITKSKELSIALCRRTVELRRFHARLAAANWPTHPIAVVLPTTIEDDAVARFPNWML